MSAKSSHRSAAYLDTSCALENETILNAQLMVAGNVDDVDDRRTILAALGIDRRIS